MPVPPAPPYPLPATVLSGARLVLPDRVVPRGWVRIAGDRIAAMGEGDPPRELAAAHRPLDGATLLPGFVDLHCHGGGGAAFADGPEAARAAAAFHRAHGTTTLIASLVTGPAETMAAAAAMLAALPADIGIAGVHLEGPFLSRARCGAQDPRYLRAPDRGLLADLLTAGAGAVRAVTLAPELGGAFDLIADLRGAGLIAAVGHTDADFDTARGAIDAGARLATHLFNGMAPVAHRAPGAALAALLDDRVVVELINDGAHLHPAVVQTALRTAGPDRAALVTDAMAAAGMPDGGYRLGTQDVVVRAGSAWLADGSSLAGSTLTMDAAVRRTAALGVGLRAAAHAAATVPARLLGMADSTGALRPGLRADIAVAGPDLRVRAVIAGGRPVHDPEGLLA
ncbi:N-acetylglucosamine-6-phosphate deacetylase [Murinocardiopsis flavida]|uniref:N-acetylglucosamine-6-phosphate deacetylase n=1 Tax=Murinocardiopsis flavida TaxID=645275 RepID=A0A2P8DML1_9ACTN|nr:N-acetylglucosamine-6-phosphate deacetylase [Murinocardiopsis flavida]PSK98456.1 N-acetylglucosamine-6-phosphate deacetylase [Murinocardiopsis flavida]